MNIFETKNAELVTEFDRFIHEHPEFSDKIPSSIVDMAARSIFINVVLSGK